MKLGGVFLFLVLAIVACSRQPVTQADSPSVPDVPAAPRPTAVIEGEETVTLKLLSFNVLYGAGSDRRFDINIPERFKGRNRMSDLMDYLTEAQPDILAVQEAGGWVEGARPVASQIAEALGMTYVVAADPWDLHVMLFSRFPIIEAAAVSRAQGFNGVVLVAQLAIGENLPLNVIVPHLYSMSSQTRLCQVEALKAMLAPLQGRSLLLGDMNFRPGSNEARSFESSGWQLAAWRESSRVDQVWVDPGTSYSIGGWWDSLPLPAGISDHLPIGADVTLSVPRRAINGERLHRNSTLTPQTMNYACAIPTPSP
jgi:endonuclease/exonuclease/phosphatase family metal-dependent hydrolase